MSDRRLSDAPPWIWTVYLIVLVCLAYAPSFSNDFVWDDHFFIERSPVVQGKKPLSDAWLKPVKYERVILPLWRPLPTTFNTLLEAFSGDNPYAFHLAGAAWHAGAVVLLFFLLRRFRIQSHIAFAAAALYGVHPYLTSAVGYVAGMADPMAGFFSLAALLLWASASDAFDARPSGTDWQKKLLAGLAAWLAALFCKEWAILVPVLAAIMLPWRGRGRFWKTGLCAVLFVAGAYYCFRSEVFAGVTPVTTIRMGWLERIAAAVMSFGFYLGGGLVPIHLRMDRYYRLDDPEFWAWYAAGVLLLLGSVLAARKFWTQLRSSGAWRGFAWFLLFWLFHSNLILVLNAHVAEHWMYFAYPGLAWSGADLWTCCNKTLRPHARNLAAGVCVGVGLFWAARGFVRQEDWRNDIVFFECNLSAGADTSRSHRSLASAYAREGQFSLALPHFARAVEKDPADLSARWALARCYFFTKDYVHAAVVAGELRAQYPTDPVIRGFEAECRKRVSSAAKPE